MLRPGGSPCAPAASSGKARLHPPSVHDVGMGKTIQVRDVPDDVQERLTARLSSAARCHS